MVELRKQTDVTMPAEEAEAHIAEVLARVEAEGEAVVLERGGEPRAAIVSIEAYRELRELHERRRREAFRRVQEVAERTAPAFVELSDQEIEEMADAVTREAIDNILARGEFRFERSPAPFACSSTPTSSSVTSKAGTNAIRPSDECSTPRSKDASACSCRPR